MRKLLKWLVAISVCSPVVAALGIVIFAVLVIRDVRIDTPDERTSVLVRFHHLPYDSVHVQVGPDAGDNLVKAYPFEN